MSNLGHTVAFTLKGSDNGLIKAVDHFALFHGTEFLLIERHFHGKNLEHLHRQVFVIARTVIGIGQRLYRVIEHIHNIDADTFSHQSMVTLGINHITLCIHHIVVFEQSLTDSEVILLYPTLGVLDGLGNHIVFDHLIFFKTQTVEHFHYPIGSEQTHNRIFERNEEHRRTRVSLTTGTTTQLTVYTTRFVTLGSDNRQTSGFTHGRRELDIGSTTGHVGSDRDRTCLSGLCHDLGLALVQLGVQYIVFNLTQSQHTAQQFRYFDRSRTYQYRTTCFYHFHDFFDDGVVFRPFGFIYPVVHIDTSYRLIGRNRHDIELINIPELPGFGLGSTGHTGQLVIHTEIVLQSNRRKSLRSGLYLNVLFRLDSLVQTIGVAAAFHDTPRLFIDNFHFIVDYHILVVQFEKGIRL